MWLANFPFLYTYVVRLRSLASAANIVLCEWFPVALILKLFYSASLGITFLMLAGNFMLYECGYLLNDLADSSADPHGRHFEARRVNVPFFYSSRLAIFAIVLSIVWVTKGTRFATIYLMLVFLLLMGFLWHTSRRPRKLHFLRIFTFALLQLYKAAPIVIPQVPMTDAAWILTAIFFCWGLWRFVAYVLTKFGVDPMTRGRDFDPLRLLHPMSLVICGPLLLTMHGDPLRSATAVLWLVYVGVAAIRSSFQLSKWKVVWR